MTRLEHTIRIFEGQDFESIRLECRREQKLFEDPLFPAQPSSLSDNYHKLIPNWHGIIWKRPGEIVDDPQLIVNGIRRTDPNQGDLGKLNSHKKYYSHLIFYRQLLVRSSNDCFNTK